MDWVSLQGLLTVLTAKSRINECVHNYQGFEKLFELSWTLFKQKHLSDRTAKKSIVKIYSKLITIRYLFLL